MEHSVLAWVRDAMRDFPGPWFIAGGWALDLSCESRTRLHTDVDVAVMRDDQQHLHASLPDWKFAKSVHVQLSPWPEDERLELPLHEIYAQLRDRRLEFLLNERRGQSWVYRRNAAITLPFAALGATSSGGLPYLAPEVVLLFKAKSPRLIDDADLVQIAPRLRISAKWLASALAVCHPRHPWLARLVA